MVETGCCIKLRCRLLWCLRLWKLYTYGRVSTVLRGRGDLKRSMQEDRFVLPERREECQTAARPHTDKECGSQLNSRSRPEAWLGYCCVVT